MAVKVYSPFSDKRLALAQRSVDFDPSLMTDVYFTRTREVLRKKNINPWVRGQIFLRNPGKKECRLAGIHELIAVFAMGDFFKNGGRIWALPEGTEYGDTDTVAVVEGWEDDFVELETIYLGVLSHETTRANFGVGYLDLAAVERRVKEMAKYIAISDYPRRDLVFFGARHYSPHAVRALTQAAFDGGATLCSTRIDALNKRGNPVGTIPHFLQNVLAGWYVDADNAVARSIQYFDQEMDPRIARVCLIDWRNRELTDAQKVIQTLGDGKLHCFRLDTAGENICEGALAGPDDPARERWDGYLPPAEDPIGKYWWGHGVTVSAAVALIEATRGRAKVPPFLTSGFSNPAKVKAFTDAEVLLGRQLFSGIGFGEVTHEPCCFAKLDLIGVGKDPHSVRRVHKKGRDPKPNPKLVQAAGTFRSQDERPVFGEDVGFLELVGA